MDISYKYYLNCKSDVAEQIFDNNNFKILRPTIHEHFVVRIVDPRKKIFRLKSGVMFLRPAVYRPFCVNCSVRFGLHSFVLESDFPSKARRLVDKVVTGYKFDFPFEVRRIQYDITDA